MNDAFAAAEDAAASLRSRGIDLSGLPQLDLATRAHNHSRPLDPIVRSRLQTDFYKLMQQQFIYFYHRDVDATFAVTNRSRFLNLGDMLDERDIEAQFRHAMELHYTRSETIWLNGNSFFGQTSIFRPEFISYLEQERLPEYQLERRGGELKIRFPGRWLQSNPWEIHALSIISELKTRAAIQRIPESKRETYLRVLYARATAKLWDKIALLKDFPDLRFAEMGLRRAHSCLWHAFVLRLLAAELPAQLTGTSNAYLAFKTGLEAIGTNGHELPMTVTALARTDEEMRSAQYRVLEQWQELYSAARIILPDTYGSTQFFEGAPEFLADWAGARLDSKEPKAGGDEYLAWVTSKGRNPAEKRVMPSDGLDAPDMVELHRYFHPKARDSSGVGGMLANDFIGCDPRPDCHDFDQISLVCKVYEVNGRPAVKLSDNYKKSTGPADEVARYRRVFGTRGVANIPVTR